MFTGIIEEVATINAINKRGSALSLHINSNKVLQDTKVGDSISVNGVCLTVAKLNNTEFWADVMPETVRLTNLKNLTHNSLVNLERAAKVGDRIGGHIISGHVDGTAVKTSQYLQNNAYVIKYSTSKSITNYLIKKGSIAIDGVSLTIVDVFNTEFTVSVIPTTQRDTTITQTNIGGVVNIECDMLAKYIEKFVSKDSSNITLQFLKDNNFA